MLCVISDLSLTRAASVFDVETKSLFSQPEIGDIIAPMKRLARLCFPLIYAFHAFGQTDETIFREFQFDFSTPGARANAMGRAFVGLSDEATAAYNNPAGLSVLNAPEFSLEYRHTHSRFDALEGNAMFELLDGSAERTAIDLEEATFASFSISKGKVNFSFFFVNHLDYRRPLVDETTFWGIDNDFGDTFNYINDHEVKKIVIDTYGLSFSRRFGKWSLGLSVGLSNFELNYRYRTSLSSDDFPLTDIVRSQAKHESLKPTYVLGSLYQVHPKLKLALSYKMQPKFKYQETVITRAFPDATPLPVTFKVPDSFQAGMAYQPDDFWTLVLEVDWVQYQQLSGKNFTILSAIDQGPGQDLFRFQPEDYKNGNEPEVRFGAEYLYPKGKHIFALRAGFFSNPDHKTRFVGVPGADDDPRIYQIQDFVFNTGNRGTTIGHSFGIGYVWNNKFQLDLAFVDSDRFRWMVSSFLYRF